MGTSVLILSYFSRFDIYLCIYIHSFISEYAIITKLRKEKNLYPQIIVNTTVITMTSRDTVRFFFLQIFELCFSLNSN